MSDDMTHPGEDRLYDYIDDLLCREERAELEQHLAHCEPCTKLVRAERELRRELAALPRSIEPPPELLAAIHAEIDAQPLRVSGGPTAAMPLRERSLRSLRWPLAAAALVLVTATALVTSAVLREPDAVAVAEGGSGVVHEVLAVEGRYVSAAAELEAVLAAGSGQLAPATRALLEDNLRVIDRALTESRAALAADPGNAALAELLRSAYEQKLALLRRATRATGET